MFFVYVFVIIQFHQSVFFFSFSESLQFPLSKTGKRKHIQRNREKNKRRKDVKSSHLYIFFFTFFFLISNIRIIKLENEWNVSVVHIFSLSYLNICLFSSLSDSCSLFFLSFTFLCSPPPAASLSPRQVFILSGVVLHKGGEGGGGCNKQKERRYQCGGVKEDVGSKGRGGGRAGGIRGGCSGQGSRKKERNSDVNMRKRRKTEKRRGRRGACNRQEARKRKRKQLLENAKAKEDGEE